MAATHHKYCSARIFGQIILSFHSMQWCILVTQLQELRPPPQRVFTVRHRRVCQFVWTPTDNWFYSTVCFGVTVTVAVTTVTSHFVIVTRPFLERKKLGFLKMRGCTASIILSSIVYATCSPGDSAARSKHCKICSLQHGHSPTHWL
jgi:hypothetical protein